MSGGTGGRLLAQDSEKNLCDDPFQTVPGSIPGSCIPACFHRYPSISPSWKLAWTEVLKKLRKV